MKSPLGENKAKESKKKISKIVETKSVVKTEKEDIKDENSEESEVVKKEEIEVVKKALKKSPSPHKTKMKEEKTTPETKKGTKNVMSFFVKKEVNGSAGEKKEGGLVTGDDTPIVYFSADTLVKFENKTMAEFLHEMIIIIYLL